MSFIFDSRVLSVYTSMTFLMFTPLYDTLDTKTFNIVFVIADALSRGSALAPFLVRFRMMQVKNLSGRETLLGQVLMGTLAICGGGLLHSWIVLKKPVQASSWNFHIALVVVIVMVSLFEIEEKTAWGIQSIIVRYLPDLSIGLDEKKFIACCILSVGFLMNPAHRIRNRIPKINIEKSKKKRNSFNKKHV